MWQLNGSKFQTIILDKKQNNHTQEITKIGKKVVKVKTSVKPLGDQIAAELNFNLHIVFSHVKSLKKVEILQKRAPRFLYDDYNSPPHEILKKSGKISR